MNPQIKMVALLAVGLNYAAAVKVQSDLGDDGNDSSTSSSISTGDFNNELNLGRNSSAVGDMKINQKAVQTLLTIFRFSRLQVEGALKKYDNDVALAADYLFQLQQHEDQAAVPLSQGRRGDQEVHISYADQPGNQGGAMDSSAEWIETESVDLNDDLDEHLQPIRPPPVFNGKFLIGEFQVIRCPSGYRDLSENECSEAPSEHLEKPHNAKSKPLELGNIDRQKEGSAKFPRDFVIPSESSGDYPKGCFYFGKHLGGHTYFNKRNSDKEHLQKLIQKLPQEYHTPGRTTDDYLEKVIFTTKSIFKLCKKM